MLSALAVLVLGLPEGALVDGAPLPSPSPLSAEELDKARAGTSVETYVATDQALTALNSDNNVVGDTVGSGGIGFSNGALQGYSGIGNFVLNTGHNNNVQGAVNVQIVVLPPTP